MTVLARDAAGATVPVIYPGASQDIAVSLASAQSAPVGAHTTVIRLAAKGADCRIAIGLDPCQAVPGSRHATDSGRVRPAGGGLADHRGKDLSDRQDAFVRTGLSASLESRTGDTAGRLSFLAAARRQEPGPHGRTGDRPSGAARRGRAGRGRLMPVTDWKQAATAVNVDRSAGAAWANPANASGSDDLRAVCDVGKNDFGDWLRLTNFGFDGAGGLPADAGLATCEVEIERQSEAAGNISDSAIFLRVTAGQVGVNQASATGWTTNADTTATYSFSVAGLTAADIRTVDFGIEISADNSNGLSAREARIDNLRMRWVYDLALGGAYSLGGQVAALKLSRRLSAAAGAIALNGNPAVLARRLAADAGSLVVTGRAATLGAARQLTAAPGAVVPTGQPVGLRVTRLPLSTGLGAYALAGKAATLSESGSPPTLAGETGSLVVAGQPAALKLGRVLAAAADAYALAGKDAALSTGGAPNPPGRRVARGMMVNVGRFIGH